MEVAAWVGAATLFGLGIGATMGTEKAEEYFAGYLLEQSLSVDNLFVFVLVFDYFQVPNKFQPRVLSYGIYGRARPGRCCSPRQPQPPFFYYIN